MTTLLILDENRQTKKEETVLSFQQIGSILRRAFKSDQQGLKIDLYTSWQKSYFCRMERN